MRNRKEWNLIFENSTEFMEFKHNKLGHTAGNLITIRDVDLSEYIKAGNAPEELLRKGVTVSHTIGGPRFSITVMAVGPARTKKLNHFNISGVLGIITLEGYTRNPALTEIPHERKWLQCKEFEFI